MIHKETALTSVSYLLMGDINISLSFSFIKALYISIIPTRTPHRHQPNRERMAAHMSKAIQ